VLPTDRGVLLDADDVVRRAVIMALMCHFEVSKEAVEHGHLIRFDEYFAREQAALAPFIDEGMVEVNADWITVLPRGKLLIRAIAMNFDRYLPSDQRIRKYSKIV
jgi:oxygen-independent coproporphyrinogen-3 oxidase